MDSGQEYLFTQMWLFYVGICVAVIFILDYFLLDRRQYQLTKKLNSPPRLPLIGHAWVVLGVKPKELQEFSSRLRKKYITKQPEILCGYVGCKLEASLSDYKYVEKILTSPKFISKSSMYDFLGDVLGNGLLFSTNQKWFDRRRIITPTFHFKILKQFFDVFQKQSKILVKDLEGVLDGREFDITPYISMAVLKSLCESAMGCEINENDYSFLKAVKELSFHVTTSFLTPWHRIKFIFNRTSTKKAQDQCAKTIHDFTTKLIIERRNFLTQNSSNENLNKDDLGLKKKMCLLDVLLQSQINEQPLSNSDIQEEVDTFTFAGHDTTTIAICFTLYMISKHKDVQEKLNKEIDEILGDGDLTFEHLNQFKYLEMVIKETLRLYPPVPIISRRLFEEVDFGDFMAPGNTNYNIALFALLKDERNFENPDEFIPERFLKDVPAFAFIPFSAGQKFAMINIKSTVISILRKYEILPGSVEPSIEFHITLKSNGIFLILKKK